MNRLLWQAPPTCPVPSCQEPVILSPVQCRHARSPSFSHLSSAIMPAACHFLTCPVPSCQQPVILPPVQCHHASSLSFSHLSSVFMPEVEFRSADVTDNLEETAWSPWSQRGESMERVGFFFFCFSQNCALSHCVGCFVFTLFRDALWTGKKGECGCQGL